MPVPCIAMDQLSRCCGRAGGLPIGAVLVSDAVADVMKPGDHGSTFAGNPLVCRAAEIVLDVRSPSRRRLAVSDVQGMLTVSSLRFTACPPGACAMSLPDMCVSLPVDALAPMPARLQRAVTPRALRRRSSRPRRSWRACRRAARGCGRACAARWPATRTSKKSAGWASSAACSWMWCAPAPFNPRLGPAPHLYGPHTACPLHQLLCAPCLPLTQNMHMRVTSLVDTVHDCGGWCCRVRKGPVRP